jgi:hypothetical protein
MTTQIDQTLTEMLRPVTQGRVAATSTMVHSGPGGWAGVG